MRAQNKEISISIIRGIAMLMVITCHLSEELSRGMTGREADFFLRFGNYCANGVQIFLFISGYLYSNKDSYFDVQGKRIPFLGKCLKKILFPYYVYSFLVILPVYALLRPESLTARGVAGFLLTSDTLEGVHHLWFIPYILLCYILTPALYDIRTYAKKKKISILKLVLVLCIGAEIYCCFFSSYFVPEWICAYCIGYYWNDLYREIEEKRWKKRASVALFGAMLASNGFRYLARYMVEKSFIELGLGDFVTRVCNWSQVLFALVLFAILHRKIRIGNVGNKLVAFSDRYSYTIYLAHMIYIKGPLKALSITDSLMLNLGVTIVLVFVSGVGLFHVCQWIELMFARRKAKA